MAQEQSKKAAQEQHGFVDFFDAEQQTPHPEQAAEQTPIPQSEQREIPPSVELPKERVEDESNGLEKTLNVLRGKLKKSKKIKDSTIPQVRDDVTREVELILEDGLGDAFQALTPLQQQEFKIKGEQVAFEIRGLLKSTHLKIRKIFTLIFDWLKMLPGVNRFFLQQEAKIKVDKIVALHQKYKPPKR